jgi:hypothetical protein
VGTPLPLFTELFCFQRLTAQPCAESLYFQWLTAKNKKLQDLGLFTPPDIFFVKLKWKSPPVLAGFFLSIFSLAGSTK